MGLLSNKLVFDFRVYVDILTDGSQMDMENLIAEVGHAVVERLGSGEIGVRLKYHPC